MIHIIMLMYLLNTLIQNVIILIDVYNNMTIQITVDNCGHRYHKRLYYKIYYGHITIYNIIHTTILVYYITIENTVVFEIQ